MPDSGKRSDRILFWLVAFLAISAAYLYPFPQANILYAVIVLLHAVAGVLATIFLVPLLFRLLRSGSFTARAGWLLIAAGAVAGLVLIKTGTLRDFLDNSAVDYQTADAKAEMKTADIAQSARAFTLLISCSAPEETASVKRPD